MPPLLHRPAALASLAAILLTGCASPGPPRSPSLYIPAPATDLTAIRRGNTVDLRVTLPQRTTDHLPLRAPTVSAQLCRALASGPCTPLATPQTFPRLTGGHPTIVTLHDPLPADLTTGDPRLLTYRIQLLNDLAHTAGFSDPTYTVSGPAPPPVQDLAPQGSRLGIILSWSPTPNDDSEVVLRREDLAPKPQQPSPATATKSATIPVKRNHRTKPQQPTATAIHDTDPNVVWLTTTPSPDATQPAPSRTNNILDTTALPDEPYRYAAERRRSLQLGGRTLELRSELSPTISFTLYDIYPPPVPTDLSAASFTPPNAGTSIAVDLIWQPVDDAGLRGYNIYRQPLDATGTPTGPNQRLNPQPVPLPAFHDELPAATADLEALRFRYSVTAIDAKGNESGPCTTTLTLAHP